MSIGNDAARGILFDLDGTLVDTAPDMVAALIRLQEELGDPAVNYELARSNVSNGAAGLVRAAFPGLSEASRVDLQQRFLRIYQRNVCEKSRLFPGLAELLEALDQQQRPWGIVTNKPQAFTDPILIALGLQRRMACAISGDTLPQRKPNPAPMLLASRMLDIEPEHIVYVGDAARDIDAGRAAGMSTIAAGWGYITDDDDPANWQADAIAPTPADLTQLLSKELG